MMIAPPADGMRRGTDADSRAPSLASKLGIKAGEAIFSINPPADYAKLLAPLPGGVRFAPKIPKDGARFVHLFVASLAELEEQLPRARKAMARDGSLWVSWYKKAAKIPTDVTEDLIRERALATDLVDVKVCAVSEIWSGLKLVIRKHLR
jgi:hypothetical protein